MVFRFQGSIQVAETAFGGCAFLTAPDYPFNYSRKDIEMMNKSSKVKAFNAMVKKLHVLIVDDIKTHAIMLQESFEANGYVVDSAFTVNEASKAFTASHYDVAVIDHDFESGRGATLLADFRKKTSECVFIIITGDLTPDPSLSLIRQGASDCLRKPFDPEYLVERCFRALRERNLLRVHDHLGARARELQASEKNLKAIFETFDDLYYQTDLNGIVTMISPSLNRLSGWNQDEIIGQPVTMVYDDPGARKTLLKAMAEKGYLRDYELSLIKKDGTRTWVSLAAHLVHDSNGSVTGLAGSLRDISHRKQIEAALKESEEKFRILTESSPSAIMLYQNDKWVYVNTAATDITGYSLDEFRTMDFWDIVHPDDKEMIRERGLKRQKDETAPSRYEFKIITKNGMVKWVYLSGATTYLGGQPAGIISVIDITDRVQAEEERERLQSQLNQIQKMDSVGRLAGGVAHDFNNMLGVILGRTEIGLMRADPGQQLYQDLKEIRKAAERSSDLTRQLLAFARKQTVAPKILDLNDVVDGMLKMLHRLIGEDIELVWSPGENLPTIKMDPSQLDQILANLCVNARDAIAGVGKVTIETGVVELDEEMCANHLGISPGCFVVLSVSDDGCGMDNETQDKLFEPFFTTKSSGLGTGLGLSTVYGIIKQNNGFIDVSSEPGRGSVFKIHLPMSMGKPERITGESESPASRGAETILIVEDEPMILEMAEMMLQYLGYNVLSTGLPSEAIRLAENHKGKIHLLLTDVVMPGMNGRDLAVNLMSKDPDLKCMFMSGYTADVIAHHGVLDEGVNFIQKPFTMKDLSDKVRAALDTEKEK